MKKEKKQNKNKERIAELENNWKRALADYQNLQKRFVEEKESVIRFANVTLLMRMLPVLDNLELMSAHNKDEGLKMTIKEFERVLDEEGLEEIKVKGKKFDAKTMDAVETVTGKAGYVVEVIQKGYLLRDKILRPARVKVGQKKEK